MDLHLVHFEHAAPAMADLGLEHLLGPLAAAIVLGETAALAAALDPESVGLILKGLASAGEKRAARRLLVALSTPGNELFKAEGDPKLMATLLEAAAKRPLKEGWQEITGFFDSLGVSIRLTPGSSADANEGSETPNGEPDPSSAPETPEP